MDYAIKCFRIVEKHETPQSPGEPPTVAAFMCGCKLGNLYRRKGDTTSAIKEFNKVLALYSHPNVITLSDEERGWGDYWVNKARKELAEIKR